MVTEPYHAMLYAIERTKRSTRQQDPVSIAQQDT